MVRDRRHPNTRQAHQDGQDAASSTPGAAGCIRSTGPAIHGSGRSSHPLRSYRVRPSIAHRRSHMRCFVARIDHAPSAAFTRRLASSSRRASLPVSILCGSARRTRGCPAHAHCPLAAHAPRARASASPGTADGRSSGSAQTLLSRLRLSSLEGIKRGDIGRCRPMQLRFGFGRKMSKELGPTRRASVASPGAATPRRDRRV